MTMLAPSLARFHKCAGWRQRALHRTCTAVGAHLTAASPIVRPPLVAGSRSRALVRGFPAPVQQAPVLAPARRRASSTDTAQVQGQQDQDASSSSPAKALGGIGGAPNVVQVLQSRGLMQDVTSPDLERAASQRQLSVYCGFDPTAESLHLGNLLGIIVLSWFQRCGHRPVALLGGATGRVGDPSGKSAERPVLSEETIERNVSAIERTLRKLLRPSAAAGGQAAAAGGVEEEGGPLVVNNLSWFGGMGFLQFLRDVGKYARVGTMLAKDSVRTRLESDTGISYTEFTYQLLQGYDFVHLRRNFGVDVQVGGSDQWGNITAGTELMRKMSGVPEEAPEQQQGGSDQAAAAQEQEDGAAAAAAAPDCFGMTFPLLVGADGKKFGKSEGGAIWLSSEMLSPYKFYQYLFKTTDADVIKFLKMLTFLPLEEIDAVQSSMAQPGYVPNTAQRRLAEEVTRFVHGEEGLHQAIKTTQALAPGSATELDADSLEAIAGDAPTADLPRESILGQPLVEVLVSVGLQPSKGAARRLIKGGGVRLNNAKVGNEAQVVSEDDLIDGRLLLLATGKKNKMLVRVVQ